MTADMEGQIVTLAEDGVKEGREDEKRVVK